VGRRVSVASYDPTLERESFRRRAARERRGTDTGGRTLRRRVRRAGRRRGERRVPLPRLGDRPPGIFRGGTGTRGGTRGRLAAPPRASKRRAGDALGGGRRRLGVLRPRRAGRRRTAAGRGRGRFTVAADAAAERERRSTLVSGSGPFRSAASRGRACGCASSRSRRLSCSRCA
jgi:hypothetical protein